MTGFVHDLLAIRYKVDNVLPTIPAEQSLPCDTKPSKAPDHQLNR